MDLAAKILKEIEVQQIRPLSKSLFVLRRVLIVVALVLTILLGAFTISLALFAIRSESMEMQRGIGFLSVAADRLPLLLSISGILFSVMGVLIYRKTRHGYRARAHRIVAAILLTTVLGGLFFYETNAVFQGHRFLMQHVPRYQSAMHHYRANLWNQPQQGRIAGVIVSTEWDFFLLKDFQGREWEVDDVDAHWRIRQMREAGDSVKVMGVLREDSAFDAHHVIPWRGGSPMYRNFRRSPGDRSP